MISINILIRDFSLNSRGFLFPIIHNRTRLLKRGYKVRFFRSVRPELFECDVLGVDSKHHRDRWLSESVQVLEEFERFRNGVQRVLFFDTGDSSGALLPAVLPFVDTYCKAQLLHDRKQYLRPHYGGRLFADFYHRHFGVVDDPQEWSQPIQDPALLSRLAVSWNTALADYGVWGLARMRLYRRIPLRRLLRYPGDFDPPGAARDAGLFCRMYTDYPHRSVAYQRQAIAKLELCKGSTTKLRRRAYFQELRRSKAVISPFGYGEITLKDFETFLCGALLIKPDMSAIETWPDLFRSSETMVAHSWGLDDVREVVEAALDAYDEFVPIARHGQAMYRYYIASEEGHEEFVDRFERLVNPRHSRDA